jgi:pyrimidine-nucleoside phosphorylase
MSSDHIRTEDARASFRIQASIVAKREGETLSALDIRGIVNDYENGRVPDHQMAAWLATIACRGLNLAELTELADAYVSGGERLHLDRMDRVVLDKHSTGGVGDKVSLVVAPIVAACGVAVVKMSGRGLGHAGGTIDKLESIPGIRLDLEPDDIYALVERVGMTIVSQSPALAPGDGATYALRDVTGTVESVPLIAASIVSKKVAVGASGLVLDVKTGAGALIPDRSRAGLLAETMLQLAMKFGLTCGAVLSDMSQPLGRAVGNAFELKEALSTLRGERAPRLWEVCAVLARLMLQSAEPTLSDGDADARVARAVASGAAYERFLEWASAQGGDRRTLERPELLPGAEHVVPITAVRDGWVRDVAPRAVGMASVHVGAGRLAHRAPLDHGSGVWVAAHVGDRVEVGQTLAELHYNGGDHDMAVGLLTRAIEIGDEPVAAPPLIHQVFESHVPVG